MCGARSTTDSGAVELDGMTGPLGLVQEICTRVVGPRL